MISRRGMLRVGGGVAMAGASIGLLRAIDQGLVIPFDQPGLAAWRDWNAGRFVGPLALVAAGILASSPHNSQPWRFAVGRLGVDVFEVPERNLGAMDPFGRERLAGLGAAIHNMAIASTGTGLSALVRLLPDSENLLHVARIELGPPGSGPAPHALLPAIGRRHTQRGAWTGAPVGNDDLVAFAAFPRPPEIGLQLFSASSARGQRFAALTNDATAAIASDAQMMADSHRWFRHARRDQQDRMDGLSLNTSGLPPLTAFAGAMLPDQTPADEGGYWRAATRDTALPTASVFGLLTAGNPWDRRIALQIGAAWQRLHLIATARGLVAQPLNQLPEIIDRARDTGRANGFAAAARSLAPDPISFAFRIGHAAPAPASLRRPVSKVIGAPARLGYDVGRAEAETAAHEHALAGRARP